MALALVLAFAGLGWFAVTSFMGREDARRRLEAAENGLDRAAGTISSLTRERDALRAQLSEGQGEASGLRAELAEVQAELKRLRQTRPPNGEGIIVEVSGYEGLIDIHDVHLRRAYGFSDLVGIAVNTSGRDLTYVQLGCTLLDREGRVLANVIDNRESWPDGATWGFDCSAEVKATGGIVRVDSLE
jgi:hypothetical protein